MKGLLGKKIGMSRVYDEKGCIIPVTVLQVGPCTVIATRTKEKNGYAGVQLGFGDKKWKVVAKPVQGHITASGYKDSAPRWVREIRMSDNPTESVGDKLSVDLFSPGDFVDVVGTTKGKGFQGVVRRYGFRGGRASHGGGWTRKPGSIGMCEKPGKVYKGRKMPGHMGNKRKTTQNLKIIRVDSEDNVILIKGAVPGPNGGLIIVKNAKKK